MKIPATIGPKYVVFSVAQHDYRKSPDGTMADGGCWLDGYYSRFANGERGWIELEGVTYAELFTDYQYNSVGPDAKRLYGVHLKKDVKILPKEDWPDTESLEWKIENSIWGTYGKDGKGQKKYILLKDAETDHLRAILDTQHHLSDSLREVIEAILERRKALKNITNPISPASSGAK